MRVLIACEFSGIVREAFRKRGHDAWSCDLLETAQPGAHYAGDVRILFDGWIPVMFSACCNKDGDCPVCGIDFSECQHPGPTQDDEYEYMENEAGLFARPLSNPSWDLMIAHPPCTHLACSGAKHFEVKRKDGRQQAAIQFFMAFTNTAIKKVCIENPIGIMSKLWRKPDQIIQPFYFGDEAQKTTCLWLSGLPPLIHNGDDDLFNTPKTHCGRGKFVTTKSGKTLPEWYSNASQKDRKLGSIRSKTYNGIANAMAEQWG